MSPLQNVDNPYFKNIFDYLEISKSGLSIMSRRTLGRCINDNYEKKITDFKKQLRDIKTVCTTADIWSGKKRNVFFKRSKYTVQVYRQLTSNFTNVLKIICENNFYHLVLCLIKTPH